MDGIRSIHVCARVRWINHWRTMGFECGALCQVGNHSFKTVDLLVFFNILIVNFSYDLDVNQYMIHTGSSSSEDGGIQIEIGNIFLHPKYDAVSNNFDFALLKLGEKLKFAPKIQPIALPNADTVFKDDTWCNTVGWGKQNQVDYVL